MIFPRLFIVTYLLVVLLSSRYSSAESLDSSGREIKIGFIGSLSSFAAGYGTAVLEGARLAVHELKANGVNVHLKIEDDQSISKNTVNAYLKLKNIDKIDGLIGGSWWINSIVKQAERDNLPLVSCETLYNEDTVQGKSYFILQGDLKEWIDVYRPLIASKGWKRGAIIRYVSGFGSTLSNQMAEVFSVEGRSFVGAIEYNDIKIPDASDLILRLKRMKADVVYIDAQPGGLSNVLKKLNENGMTEFAVLTNSIADDLIRSKQYDVSGFRNLYFSKRTSFDEAFSKAFREYYKKEPILNADLGYYGMHLITKALISGAPIDSLRSGMQINEKTFNFNELNVYSGAPQEIFIVDHGQAVKLSKVLHSIEK